MVHLLLLGLIYSMWEKTDTANSQKGFKKASAAATIAQDHIIYSLCSLFYILTKKYIKKYINKNTIAVTLRKPTQPQKSLPWKNENL